MTTAIPFGCKDVTLFTVSIDYESNAAVTVWIIFDGLHNRFNVELVTLEVDQAVVALVATATMTGGDTTLVITTTATLRNEQ